MKRRQVAAAHHRDIAHQSGDALGESTESTHVQIPV
jgi:hypothetical protein